MDKYQKAGIAGLIYVIIVAAVLLLWAYSCMAADLTLAWEASDGATDYKVQMSADLGATWGESLDAGSGTTFTWVGAPDNGLVLFRASAYNTQGESTNYTKGAWFNGAWNPPVAARGLGLK